MKVSLQLIQNTTSRDITSIGAQAIATKIGAQLGAVEEVVDWGGRYDGVVVAKVVSCVKHPNADKLSVCRIDDGGVVKGVERDNDGLIQVVCGAPNVRTGLRVAWIPPGVAVPASFEDKEPFVLGKRELRGILSNGMLASPSELAVSDEHDGILEISELVEPGTAFNSLYNLNDTVIELENKMFTHRPDCFGVIGVAREIAGIQQVQYKSPDWYSKEPNFTGANSKQLSVEVDTSLVPRFSAVILQDITVANSPVWLQSDLKKLGIRPINNIVDITNWLMCMTGQPLHAYDYDKVMAVSGTSSAILRARTSQKGEQLLLLNGKKITFTDNSTILICANDEPIGVGGVMGGADTEVDASTTTIIVEAATFDMYSVRKTSMKYGLFTDAVTRFNKGQSPLQTVRVLAKAVAMASDLAGGTQASDLCDYADKSVQPLPEVKVKARFINARLGTNLSADAMADLLRNVELPVAVNEDQLVVSIPFWRRDLHIPEDIVEEIGRLYGFADIPVVLPIRTTAATQRNEKVDFKYAVRNILSAAGANEILSYSFVHKNVLTNMGQDPSNAYALGNALSPELQYYRLSLTPSLLYNVHSNCKAGYGSFALYELGKVHSKNAIEKSGIPIEYEQLALVFAADGKHEKNYSGQAYYQARAFFEVLVSELKIDCQFTPLSAASNEVQQSDIARPFLQKRSAVVTAHGRYIGIIGEYSALAMQNSKLPVYSAGFEIDTTSLFDAYLQTPKAYTRLSKYPKVTQDITLQTAPSVTFSTVCRALTDALNRAVAKDCTVDVRPLDIYQTDTNVRYSFRVIVASYNSTMVAKDVNTLLDAAATYLRSEVDATRV